MQLPGFCSEPVRVSLDVTWWPNDDMFSHSARLWIRDDETGTWQMQAMEASALYPRHEVGLAVEKWAAHWADFLYHLAAENADVRDRPW